ncbi:single-stranded DNA-binding protein WHY2, mitochondrial [Corylus avellana]|uniref:single-stranded DNA-binding protein WHY2, mitochondrial n=1 Tax=Corylus avellana TaxID=13451 RepID=UPI00286A953B|nr:single-stranded DNA-binding protein WHY2, mitochondrial [Corylus avellana]
MMKLSRLLPSRKQLSEKLLYGKVADVKDSSWLYAFTFRAGISTARENFASKGDVSNQIFASYDVYKGKASLSVRPVLPTFTKSDSGSLRVRRRGVMMLSFLPAVGERKYDYEKKQFFALSATEVGSLISLGPKDSCEFFHDPSMLTSNSGQVRKTLSIKAHADGTGYLISLNVVNNILKTKEYFTVPVTTAEAAVIKTACSFALPHILGWDRLTNQLPRHIEGHPSKVDPKNMDLEWDK